MLFPTLNFAIFFALVFPISWWLGPHRRLWKLFILAVSYLFYGFWDWRFVGLIMLSTGVNTLLARRLAASQAPRPGWLLWLGLLANLSLLGLFKYYGFFIESLNSLVRLIGLPTRLPFLEIIVPVGISFFTFQAISYLVDVARRRITPVAWLDFAVYQAFFPHLVAGPIVRASEFVPQLLQPPRLTRRRVSLAALLIGQGLFKKVVIASTIAAQIDPIFAAPIQFSAGEILLAIYGYAIQIFADFSGYTDMAIGLALLLGIRFPANFDRPYAATSLQEFWRRWHMTLSRWLRDYLYIGLGGSRYGRRRTYSNLIWTMLLGGLWHGAALTFVAWGLWHGLGLVVERWWRERRAQVRQAILPADAAPPGASARRAVRHWLGWLITFQFVCLGWVFFRSDTLTTAATLLQRVVTAWEPLPEPAWGLAALILAGVVAQFVPVGMSRRFAVSFSRLPLVVQGAALGTFIALTLILGPTGVAPFIYYQF